MKLVPKYEGDKLVRYDTDHWIPIEVRVSETGNRIYIEDSFMSFRFVPPGATEAEILEAVRDEARHFVKLLRETVEEFEAALEEST